MDQNVTKKYPVLCDGYVKYDETEVDILVDNLKKNSNGGPCGIQ